MIECLILLSEPLESGLYFYTLTAVEFTATPKMLINVSSIKKIEM